MSHPQTENFYESLREALAEKKLNKGWGFQMKPKLKEFASIIRQFEYTNYKQARKEETQNLNQLIKENEPKKNIK
jgi:hypothetical protein